VSFSVLNGVAVCCSVLQCVAVCCSVLQCVAVSFSVLNDSQRAKSPIWKSCCICIVCYVELQ